MCICSNHFSDINKPIFINRAPRVRIANRKAKRRETSCRLTKSKSKGSESASGSGSGKSGSRRGGGEWGRARLAAAGLLGVRLSFLPSQVSCGLSSLASLRPHFHEFPPGWKGEGSSQITVRPSWVYMPSISCGQRWSLAFGPASSWGCSDGGSPPLRPQSSLQKPMRIKSKTAAEKQGGFVRAIFIGMASSLPRCLRVVASHSDVLGPSRLVELVYHGTLISAISHPAV